ncbi:phytanoyl-CoA dioxygenase family protein [Streptomyces sp. NPDC049954]|uniref:phytanoyl-CoA dioxygenase family protein n=1 Tax=Streptomyces sp. NPDC049954 TaxID=3155779 RepID=UPI00342AEB3B
MDIPTPPAQDVPVDPAARRAYHLSPRQVAAFDRDGFLVLPGSQREPWDICSLEREHGWDVPGAVSVDMAPGDVLVHDVMLVHGSASVVGKDLRWTSSYEFRSAEQFVRRAPEAVRPAGRGSVQEELRVVHQAHPPGAYCSAGDVPQPF